MESRGELCYNEGVIYDAPGKSGEKQLKRGIRMKNAGKIFDIGQVLMILGSVLYLAELFLKTEKMTLPIAIVYIISTILMLIGWIGTRDERKARKEQQKREAAEAKARKAAA